MSCPVRILLVTADMGGGHNATARALEERARVLWPDCDVRWVDTLDVMGPGVGPLFRRIYVVNVQRTPWLYEYFYNSLLRWHWFAASSKRVVGTWCGRRLQTVIDDYSPDLILSVYPLGSAGLQWLRRFRGLRVPIGAWVSDFAPHPFWVYRDLDLHLVMHETAIAPALAAEPQACVQVCAPPVTGNFVPEEDRDARTVLGLPADTFIALVSTGAYGFGDVDAGVRALLDADPSVQVVVACGRNDKRRRRLDALRLAPERLRALGWVQNMPQWLRAADIVVTNAGGATALEALACGVPVVMFDPIAAHGRANAALMAESGLALLCPTGTELTAAVQRLIGQPQILKTMARSIEEHLARYDLDSGLRTLAEIGYASVGAGGRSDAYRQPRDQAVRSADSFFLHVETPRVAQQVGTVLILEPVLGASLAFAAVQQLLAERITQLPTLRKVLRPRRGGRAPRWLVLPTVDPGEQFSHRLLAAPQELDRAVDEFFSAPLDRRKPLWAIQLVSGLDGARSALLIKLHHALGDGIAVIETLDGLLDTDSPPATASPAPWPRTSPTSGLRSALRSAATIPGGLWRLAAAGRAPAGACNGPLSTPQRHVVLTELPADQVRRLAHRLHVRSSELALSVVAGALHQLLAERGLRTEGGYQRAVVPVSLRRSQPSGRGWGNWTGAATIDLPIGPMGEHDRLRRIQQELARRTASSQPEAARAVLRLIGALPYRLHGVLSRQVYSDDWFNLIASYIPGRARQRTFAGAPIAHSYPVLPLAKGVGLAIGIMPWARNLGIGITADPVLVPDSDRLGAALTDSFAALAVDAPTGEPPGRR